MENELLELIQASIATVTGDIHTGRVEVAQKIYESVEKAGFVFRKGTFNPLPIEQQAAFRATIETTFLELNRDYAQSTHEVFCKLVDDLEKQGYTVAPAPWLRKIILRFAYWLME